MPNFAVILPAAGASTRFGSESNKLLTPLSSGLPVISFTLETFLARDDVDTVVIATRSDSDWRGEHPALRRVLDDPRVRRCAGGPSRAESVRNALAEVPRSVEWVAVHDAARPLISSELIRRTVAAAVQHGAAVPALPVVPTIKEADGPLPAKIRRTVPRQTLWAVQTPQVMRRSALEAAYAACPMPLAQVTDEAQLLELAGQEVWLVPGEEQNIKITTPDDLRVARAFLERTGDPIR